ncbi:MAG: membrane protein insertase YidC [Cellulomonadaceae bacterium]|nr:membrane protein insertase YidC [Cellulomonadaceae bacterium]
MIDTILYPLEVAVAFIMVSFHSLLTKVFGMSPGAGATWALSIVGLVIVIRIILIPLFVRQIRASRGMQLLAPEMQAIQKKYKGKTDPASREAMSRETMELYRKHGTNPFSSCLPILAQSPIFFALFRVLNSLGKVAAGEYPNADNPRPGIGLLTQQLATQANDATIFGAPISSYFLQPTATTGTRIVSVVLIVLMSVTTFTTQRQLTQKNMPASALEGPMAQQQKMLLYILPLVFAISGVNFPIGVLIYWTTTNIWSMGQQFYVIRRNPTPGSEAERQLKERRARKAAAKGIALEEDGPAIEEKPRSGQRVQPKRKKRATPGVPSSLESEPRDDAAAGTTPSATPPRTRPAGAKPAGERRAGATPAGTRPAGAKAPGSKPAGAKPAASPAGTTAGEAPSDDTGVTPKGARTGTSGAAKRRPSAPSTSGAAGEGDGVKPATPRKRPARTPVAPSDADEASGPQASMPADTVAAEPAATTEITDAPTPPAPAATDGPTATPRKPRTPRAPKK